MGDDSDHSNFLWLWFAISVLLLLSSCATGPAPVCVSKCGVELIAPVPSTWTCEEFERVEALTIKAFDHVLDPRFAKSCESLKGWKLKINPSWYWTAPGPKGTTREVAGLTYCDTFSLEVGNSEPQFSSLTHEFAHVVQRCEPMPPPIEQGTDDVSHANWTRDGIRTAINIVNWGKP